MQVKKLFTLLAFLGIAATASAEVTFTCTAGKKYQDQGGEGIEKLFDGNTSTKYCGNAGNDCYALFEASEPVYVWGYEMTTGNDNTSYGRLVKKWALYGTNDESVGSSAGAAGWIALSEFAGNDFIQRENYYKQRFFCDSTKVKDSYKYFKLVLLSDTKDGTGTGTVQLSEFKLCYDTKPIVTYKWKESDDENSKKAVDWLIGIKWEGGDNKLAGEYVTIETSDGNPYPVKSYSFTTHDDGSYFNRAPKTWKVEGSNDNSSWEPIHEVTTGDPIQNKSYTTYDFTPTNRTSAFRYVRLTLNSMKDTGHTQLGEFHVVGDYDGGENPKTYIKKVEDETPFDRESLSTEDPWYKEYKTLYDGLTSALSDAFISTNYDDLQEQLNKMALLKEKMTELKSNTSGFMALDGTNCWGDGHYSRLMDGDLTTKWGGSFSGSEGEEGYVQWVIFRSKNAIQPYFYKLITGGDTSNNSGRNWKEWKIYGGNMEYDDAIYESTDWEEIDSKTEIGQDVLPRKDQYMVPFGFSESVEKPYYYFMVKVTKAYSGKAIQMNELILGSSEDFTALKDEYMDELDKFVVPDAATPDQKTSYATAKTNVDEATPSNLLDRYSAAKAIQKVIFSSLKDDDGWYQISSKYDMDFFSELVNGDEPDAKGALTQDIDMDGIILTPFGRSKDFTGQFDGRGHVIENFVSENSLVNELGLFANTRNGAIIQNVILKNAHVVGRNNTGAIVGKAVNTTIQNCAVVDSYVEGYDHVAVIAAHAEGGTTICNNYSDAEVVSRLYQAGGIVGTIKAATIDKNLFVGTVSNPNGDASGLISRIDEAGHNPTISNNMMAATSVTGSSTYSILKTLDRDASYSNNYVLNSTTYTPATSSTPTDKDGKDGLAIDWIQATTKYFYETTLGWDFTNTWKFTCGGKYPILKIMANEDLPTQDVTVTSAGYATMVANYDYDFTSAPVETYAVTESATEGYVHLEPVTSAKHGEALLLKGGTDTYTLTATAAAKDVTAENLLKGAEEDVVSYGTKYALAKIDGIVGFYQVGTAESAVTIPAGKAYLDGVPSSVKAYIFDFDEDPDAINMVNGEGFKVNGSVYDLQGRRVEKPSKGLYIVGGRKVLF